MRKREAWETKIYNDQSYFQYYDRLVELSLSMFDWKNVPEEIDTRYLELILFGMGGAIFAYDNDLGYIITKFNYNGKRDIYRTPIKRHGYSDNGYHFNCTDKDSVIIWNNYLRLPSVNTIENYARRLSNLDRTIDININAQKTPILIRCEESEVLTLKNLYQQYNGNSPIILGNKSFDPTTFSVLNTGAPYISDRLYELKTQIWNEALTYLGISNVSFQKRERMLQDEVLRNNGGTVTSRYSRLEARKEACKKINKMFNLNIDVEFRTDIDVEKINDNNIIENGGVNNE